MSTLTFLGASGGCGATTLVALSLHLFAEYDLPAPTVLGEDVTALHARRGDVARSPRSVDLQIVDAGRFSRRKAATAVGAGRLILVGTRTREGVEARQRARASIVEEFGGADLPRVTEVVCETFGRQEQLDAEGALIMPFDRALAAGGPVSVAIPSLSHRARRTLDDEWGPFLRRWHASPLS